MSRIIRSLGPAPATDPAYAANAVRASLFALCTVVLVVRGAPLGDVAWLAPVAVAGAVAARFGTDGLPAVLLRTVEAVVTAAAVLATGGPGSPLQPYLIAPAFAGGLAAGAGGAVTPPGWAAVALLAGRFVADPGPSWRGSVAGVTQWAVLGIAVGLLGAWIRRLTQVRPVPNASYAAASHLLVQLREVTRRLPSGLDPMSIADDLLTSLRAGLPFDRAGLFVPSTGHRLIPLCVQGTTSLQWDGTLGEDSPFTAAWREGRTVRLDEPLTPGGPASRVGSALLLPLRAADRDVALVALETTTPDAYPVADVEAARPLVDDTAVRLETALLFDEVRSLATAEERQRLARQIHDGIAQELVYVGYVLDGLSSDAGSRRGDLQQALKDLRCEITRIVSELRLSIFDLRSEVSRSSGLGAALSDHVRTIGRSSGLTVHLSLSEHADRLPVRVEEEVLRIAQEAIAAARRRPSAANLWVTLVVTPPSARLVVSDDGIENRSRRREDSFGLDIMRERAERLHGSVEVTPRRGRGTTVAFTLGPQPVGEAGDAPVAEGRRVWA